MSAVGEALAAVAAVLNRYPIDWYVFGAQGVAAHGIPRATQDIDITVVGPPDLVGRWVGELLEGAFDHRFPGEADELLRRGAVVPVVHRPTGFDVDLVVGGSGLESLVASRAVVVAMDGVSVRVASATDLVTLKLLSGRAKDLDDARHLLARGDVDVGEVRGLLVQLEEATDRFDLVSGLERLILDVRSR